MTIDKRILEAIRTATDEFDQPEQLSNRIVAWMEELAAGNEDVNDDSAAQRRLESIFDATILRTEDEKGSS